MPFIREVLGHLVSRREALLDLREKHLTYWGSDAPSWVRKYPTAPLWSWANANDLGYDSAYNACLLFDKPNKILKFHINLYFIDFD